MIVFTHIPKTAGTTMKSLLGSNFGIRHVESNKAKRPVYTNADLKFAKKCFVQIKAISGHNLSDPIANIGVEDLELITILRKPGMRCISHYQDHVLRLNETRSFKEWIEMEVNQNVMVRSIAGTMNIEKAKDLLRDHYLFVGFTERFDESAKLLNLVLEKPLVIQYRTSIVARSNTLKKELMNDEASMALVIQYNQLDQQLYDYAMKELYLPLLDKMMDKIDSVKVRSNQFSLKHRISHRMSLVYNKFVYRQLIKIFYT